MDPNVPQIKPGIQNSLPMEADTEGASTSQVVDISIPTETQNRPAPGSTERNGSSSSRGARRSPSAVPINLMPRHAYPFPQIVKMSLFGYTFWLYPVGPFQFLDFGREYIDEVQPNQVQRARENVFQERFISTASTGSNPGACHKSTDIKTSGPAKVTQTTMVKVKDETDRVSSYAQVKGSSLATIESSELNQSLEAANATFIKTEKRTHTFDATEKSSTSNHLATKTKQDDERASDSSEIIKRSKQMKQEKPFEDPLCRAGTSKTINGPVRYENNAGAAARPVDKPDLFENINHASEPVASCSSGAGTSGSHSVQEPLPVWRRKAVEQMTSAEMDQHFGYICEDDDWVPPRIEPSVQELENELRLQREVEEREELEQERQMREFKEGIKPFLDYCKALLNGYIPSPEYSDDSEEEDVWLGPHKSRRSYRCPEIPDIRAIFNLPPIKRFYDIDVFCYENLMFISIRRPEERDNETVVVDGVAYVFPDYCIETPSRHGVFEASQILSGYIDNFCNTRASQNLPLDSFDRDFNSFLAMIFHNRNIYQIGMIRIRINRRF